MLLYTKLITMKKIIIVILVCVTNVLVGQVAWQQTAPPLQKQRM